MARHLTSAYSENIREHLTAHPASEHGYQIEAREIEPGLCYQDERVQVHALPADHGDLRAFSYKFVTPEGAQSSSQVIPNRSLISPHGRRVVMSSSTRSIRHLNSRIDPPAWQRYHSRVHTSTEELAELAREIRPRLLLLYHQLFWGLTADELVAEVSAADTTAMCAARTTWTYSIFERC